MGNGFVSKLDPTLSTLLYSTYFGGSGDGISSDLDSADGIALDSANPPNVYIAGQTFSTNLPVVGTPVAPLHAGLNGSASDAFVAKLTLIPTLAVTPASLSFGTQPTGVTSTPQTITLMNNTSDPIPFANSDITFSGANPADFASPSNTCGTSIAAGASCTVSAKFTPSAATAESATLVITVTVTDGGIASSQVFDVGLSGTGSASAPSVGLMPTSLAFGNQTLNTTSAAQTVTLTNNGTAALTISSIAASGDFAETSTGTGACPISPATLAASGSCTISVTFTPTATGARTGTLAINDNAGTGQQTVPLSGTGTAAGDFTLSASPTTLTVLHGAVGAPVTISVNPINGFNSAVALTCMGAPVKSSCVPNPTSVTPAPPASAMSTLTFTAHAMIVPVPVSKPAPPLNLLRIVPLFVALMLLLFVMRSTQRFRARLVMASAVLACVSLASCGGGSDKNTHTGTYTLTVTGTSGNLTHSTTVTVTVD
jgi:hypothetical protein